MPSSSCRVVACQTTVTMLAARAVTAANALSRALSGRWWQYDAVGLV
jgi:hypothetical protein